MEPLGSLFFAGEAAHETQWGTVGGAWESVERAAEAALRKIGALKDAPGPEKSGQEAEAHAVARGGGAARPRRAQPELAALTSDQPRSTPPVFLVTSAMILEATASIS